LGFYSRKNKNNNIYQWRLDRLPLYPSSEALGISVHELSTMFTLHTLKTEAS
jgi:hypothetical protein